MNKTESSNIFALHCIKCSLIMHVFSSNVIMDHADTLFDYKNMSDKGLEIVIFTPLNSTVYLLHPSLSDPTFFYAIHMFLFVCFLKK